MRSLAALIVTWAFFLLVVTGVVLFLVPQGRIAYWTEWSLLALAKEEWGNLHMVLGGLFIVAGAFHLYFNWKPFKKYLSERLAGAKRPSRELIGSLAVVLLLGLGAILQVPPVSWIFDLNQAAKQVWVSDPGMEPPFGHAEEASLALLARRMNMDLAAVEAELRRRGIHFEGAGDSLKEIAHANETTPMAIYDAIRHYEVVPVEWERVAGPTPEAVEERFTGTGVGRKSLAQMCTVIDLDPERAIDRLRAAGFQARPDEKMRAIAERHSTTPIEVLKMMVVEGYRPSK